jgi:hypothetical protein
MVVPVASSMSTIGRFNQVRWRKKLRQQGNEAQEARHMGLSTREHPEEGAGAPPLDADNSVEERQRFSEL